MMTISEPLILFSSALECRHGMSPDSLAMPKIMLDGRDSDGNLLAGEERWRITQGGLEWR